MNNKIQKSIDMKRTFNILPYFAIIALLVACTEPEVEVSGSDESESWQ